MVFHLCMYSHISVTVVKEFIKQDQQIKRTLGNSLQEQKIFIWVILFFLIVLMKIESTVQFKTKILSFIRPKENWVFKIPEINGIKLLSRIRLYFSHLNEHKCWHNFIATIDPMCRCGLEPKQHSVTSYIRIFTQTLEQSFLMIFVL